VTGRDASRPTPGRGADFRVCAGSGLGAAIAICVALLAGPVAFADAEPRNPSRLIFWTRCDRVVELSDAELSNWKARGVDGFVCMGERLWGLGGTQRFTGDPGADLEGEQYALQRRIRDTRIVQRAAARDMKLYLGFKLANYFNTATPIVDWFDDVGWSQKVLPRVWELAGAANLLGFAGIAIDQEVYQQAGGARTATWAWSYPGNARPEAAVRRAATKRGRQTMSAIVAGFPGVEIMFHDFPLPQSWAERVYGKFANNPNLFDNRLYLDFWDGMTSIEGYGALRYVNHLFYKSTHIPVGWNEALRYDANRFYAILSRRLSNWDYASSRMFWSPFSWLDPGPNDSSFDDARPRAYVANQLHAFRKWTTGGEFANFVYSGLRNAEYERYEDAMRAASRDGIVDRENPTLQITSRTHASRPPNRISGIAKDNLAIRAIRWRDHRGGRGVARMTWNARQRETKWAFPATALAPDATRVTITAEDIKGRTSSRVLAW
jgi:hypothetical protein